MRRVVFLGPLNWSIYRVHKGIENALGDEYTFIYINPNKFYPNKFLKDVKECDILITMLYMYEDVMEYLKTDEERRKVALICHGSEELRNIYFEASSVFTYGVTSATLIPEINKLVKNPIYYTPNGVDHSQFNYQERSGKIESIGWCGAPGIHCKRFDMAIQIAQKSKLPLNVAMTIPLKDVKEWYLEIDIMIVTSGPNISCETGPLPPFEAIVTGVPVIGTVVGNSSFIPGPKFSTSEEAVVIINRLQSNPKEVKRLAKEQYEYVMKNWTYDALKHHWIKMIDSIISSNQKI